MLAFDGLDDPISSLNPKTLQDFVFDLAPGPMCLGIDKDNGTRTNETVICVDKRHQSTAITASNLVLVDDKHEDECQVG